MNYKVIDSTGPEYWREGSGLYSNIENLIKADVFSFGLLVLKIFLNSNDPNTLIEPNHIQMFL